MNIFFDKNVAMDKVIEVLESRKISQRVFSIKTGISEQNIVNWKKRGVPDLEKLKIMAEALELPVNFFTGNVEAPKLRQVVASRTDSYNIEGPNIDDYAWVPKVFTPVCAGNGSCDDRDGISEFYAFKKSWLRKSHLSENNLRLMVCDGDSMYPTIKHKDTCMFDVADTMPRANNIYLVRLDNRLLVRRVAPGESMGIVLAPDNNNWPLETITVESQSARNDAILGRLVWIAREF